MISCWLLYFDLQIFNRIDPTLELIILVTFFVTLVIQSDSVQHFKTSRRGRVHHDDSKSYINARSGMLSWCGRWRWATVPSILPGNHHFAQGCRECDSNTMGPLSISAITFVSTHTSDLANGGSDVMVQFLGLLNHPINHVFIYFYGGTRSHWFIHPHWERRGCANRISCREIRAMSGKIRNS